MEESFAGIWKNSAALATPMGLLGRVPDGLTFLRCGLHSHALKKPVYCEKDMLMSLMWSAICDLPSRRQLSNPVGVPRL